MPEGIVSAVFGARCEVLAEGVPLPCILRGRLKLEAAGLVAGDRVEYRRVDAATAVVERILPRRNQLARSSREHRRRRGSGPPPQQVVLANPDQVVFVAAARNPGLDFHMLDRALALARGSNLPAGICVNKMDLAPASEVERLLAPYRAMGVPVFCASAESGEGLPALLAHLGNRLSFFWGGSGVGKSSLIRALTGADVKIGRWRTDNPRGPHTTNVTRLYPLATGGLLADTPGFDWLELDTVDGTPNRAEVLLPEAATFAAACRFPACSHCGEPGCAVMAAVLDGGLDRGRYTRFRWAVAEFAPAPRHPIELHALDEDLFFRMAEGQTADWVTFQLWHLFQQPPPVERQGFMDTLGVPPGAGEPGWVVFQEKLLGGLASRAGLQGKISASIPPGELLATGEEMILRERGTVKGVARVHTLQPTTDAWPLRKSLKGTPVYEGRAFWSDLKPPAGATPGPVFAAGILLDRIERFEAIPSLGLGALTRQEMGLVLDYLELGIAEDELAFV